MGIRFFNQTRNALSIASAHAADLDFRFVVIFSARRLARQAAQQGNLPDMSARISNRALKYFLTGAARRRLAGQAVIEFFQSGKKACRFLFPGQRR